jgi:hypothetical protein
MKLFEIKNFTQVIPGLPVQQGDNGPYVLVGEWLRHSNGERSWNELHGTSIGLEPGLPLVVGSNGFSRVMSGEVLYRGNGLVLRPCENNEEEVAGVLFRYDQSPRPTLATRPYVPETTRSLNAERTEVYHSYRNGPLVLSFASVRAGSKLTITETRNLRRAGTGASWQHPFNWAQYANVLSEVGLQFDAVTEQGLTAAVSKSVIPESDLLIEGWAGSKIGVITVNRHIEHDVLVQRMAAALGLGAVNPAKPGFKFAEVAPAA